MGGIFTVVGYTYPRLNAVGTINFFLGQRLVTYQKGDSPPNQVLPLPMLMWVLVGH